MIKELQKNFINAIYSIAPLVLIIVVLSFFIPLDKVIVVSFVISSVILIIGLTLFTFGADLSMVIIGNKIGRDLVKSKKVGIILVAGFIIGTVVTIAEPDLIVLVEQITSISSLTLILMISMGVGFCILLSSARSLFGWNLNWILLASFGLIFGLSYLVPKDFIPFAFDSGGVTTGTMSIPFILTLGMGLVANRVDKKAKEESFGMVALASTGPILMVLLLGLFYNPTESLMFDNSIYQNFTFNNYLIELKRSFLDVLLAVSPILIVFFIYYLITKNVSKREVHKIMFGTILTIIGLTLFLLASNVGYLNMGYYIGEYVANSNYQNLLVPLTMVLAFFIAIAEPAVVILIDQVKEYTEGGISNIALKIALALGVSIAAGLAIDRVFNQVDFFYYAIIGYGIVFILTFFIPKVFTSIAFDAGGATGGSLTTAFLLPISIGACTAVNGNVYSDAFGLASLVSLVPIITVEIIGLIYQNRFMISGKFDGLDDTIVEFEWEVKNG